MRSALPATGGHRRDKASLLATDQILCHPLVVLELACGTPPTPRERTIGDLKKLQQAVGPDARLKGYPGGIDSPPYISKDLERPLLPLDRQRAFQAVDSQGARRCSADFCRHFYRQPARHQHWRGLPAGSAKSDLSRSIDIYRLPRRLQTPSTRARVGQGSAQEGQASNALSYCPDSLFRQFFYRHGPVPAVPSSLSSS